MRRASLALAILALAAAPAAQRRDLAVEIHDTRDLAVDDLNVVVPRLIDIGAGRAQIAGNAAQRFLVIQSDREAQKHVRQLLLNLRRTEALVYSIELRTVELKVDAEIEGLPEKPALVDAAELLKAIRKSGGGKMKTHPPKATKRCVITTLEHAIGKDRPIKFVVAPGDEEQAQLAMWWTEPGQREGQPNTQIRTSLKADQTLGFVVRDGKRRTLVLVDLTATKPK